MRNHDWSTARPAALQRDGHRCVRCGASPDWPEANLAIAFIRLVCPPPKGPTFDEWAAAHRGWTPHATRLQYADHLRAIRREWHLAQAIIDKERKQRALEVNHRTPILGRHREFGCHHHLDGLETLCHRCHVAETAIQFGYRTAVPVNDDQQQLFVPTEGAAP